MEQFPLKNPFGNSSSKNTNTIWENQSTIAFHNSAKRVPQMIQPNKTYYSQIAGINL